MQLQNKMFKKFPPIVEVDDLGNIIGPICFSIAHSNYPSILGIRHATTNILLFKNPNYEEVLISKRAANVSAPFKYDASAGGHITWLIEKGRAYTPQETAYKELEEELFVDSGLPLSLSLKEIYAFPRQLRLNDRDYTHLFTGVWPGPFYLNSREVSEVKFVNLWALREDIIKQPNKYTANLGILLDKFLELSPIQKDNRNFNKVYWIAKQTRETY